MVSPRERGPSRHAVTIEAIFLIKLRNHSERPRLLKPVEQSKPTDLLSLMTHCSLRAIVIKPTRRGVVL
ncbi:unnamed protein product [Pleuronectes platessa]|uniref:Uncharacterized protein n=1 Tax=Pleuronectes platessa TaxID=8262 RepID=A0A9N7Y035_PLEPL|nr:unnamed protein product [Pleuronectes platessa]